MNIPTILSILCKEKLCLTQLTALALIHQSTNHGRMTTMTQLAAATKCSTAAITGAIDNLERHHLVKRMPHPDDRRKLNVTLTDEGTKKIQSLLIALNPRTA